MIRILELFGGIGACTKAMERLGIEHEIADYVEIDKYAVKSFNALHDTNYEPQDICKWSKDIPVDFIMHGSPCQDFSIAGKQAGGDEGSGTRSSLLYETLRIVEKTRPKVVLWENVKNLMSARHKPNWEKYCKRMEELGYRNYARVLNAKDYGIPQNRERVYTMSIRNDIPGDFQFPEPEPLTKKLKDVLEDSVDEKYYIKDATSLTAGGNFDTINGGAIGKMHDISRRAYHEDAIAPAMHTCGGGNTEPKVKLPGAYGREGSTHQAGSIYNPEGVALTLSTMQGGNQEPMIVASRGRNVMNSNKTEQQLEPRKDGLTNTITSVQKDNYVAEPVGGGIAVKTANKKGYDIAKDGGGIDLAYPNSTTRRGRVGHGVSKTLECSDTMAVVVDPSVKPSVAKNFEREKEQIATTDKEIYQCKCETAWQDNKVGCKVSPSLRSGNDCTYGLTSNYRIRKLTPKECWRLMGFDDEDYEKAQKVNSNTQLYKQAGNSIVVNVLEKIIANLPKEVL